MRLVEANLNGDLDAVDGHFKNPGKVALNADGLKAANVFLGNGFSADGDVRLVAANLSGNLAASNGQFKNPGNAALEASGLTTGGYLLFDGSGADGKVDLSGSNVKGPLFLTKRRFEKADELVLHLEQTIVGPLFDDEKSWPRRGNLYLDGFVYTNIGRGPTNANSRLRWLGLQQRQDSHSITFTPQPYEQLAKVLRDAGDEAGAKSVLIAMEDARWWYGKLGFWQRCWRFILSLTIRYGYEPFRALIYIAVFVTLGTLLFSWGYKSGVIAQTDKDKPEHYRPFNCFVYSLETFLPLVDLQQAKHWAPNAGLGPAFGRRLRWYLWVHIVAGWFFTLMLVAAFTGLVQKG